MSSAPTTPQRPCRESQAFALARERSQGKLNFPKDELKMFIDAAVAEFTSITAEESHHTVREQRGLVKEQRELLKDANQMTPAGQKTMEYLAQSSGKKSSRRTDEDIAGAVAWISGKTDQDFGVAG